VKKRQTIKRSLRRSGVIVRHSVPYRSGYMCRVEGCPDPYVYASRVVNHFRRYHPELVRSFYSAPTLKTRN